MGYGKKRKGKRNQPTKLGKNYLIDIVWINWHEMK